MILSYFATISYIANEHLYTAEVSVRKKKAEPTTFGHILHIYFFELFINIGL